MKLNKNINIFVLNNNDDYYVPENKYLIPLRPNDISHTSDYKAKPIKHYQSLSGMHWAWKHVDSEYYGFFDADRYFCFKNPKSTTIDCLCDETFENIGIEDSLIESTVSSHDIILPQKLYFVDGNNKKISVYDEYQDNSYLKIEDLDLLVKVVETKANKYMPYLQKVLDNNFIYPFNKTIMKKEYFQEYCEMMFPIIDEVFDKIDFKFSSVLHYKTP